MTKKWTNKWKMNEWKYKHVSKLNDQDTIHRNMVKFCILRARGILYDDTPFHQTIDHPTIWS